jgi:hypothetical protein
MNPVDRFPEDRARAAYPPAIDELFEAGCVLNRHQRLRERVDVQQAYSMKLLG